MKLFTLKCPNCGSSLEIEDGIDIFFCKYCGHKIMLEGQSNESIRAKVHIKGMEHEEKLADKEYEHERYKMKMKAKENKHSAIIGIACFLIPLLICFIVIISGNIGVNKQEEKLQTIVAEVMVDIKNRDYAEAYIKANTLYWDSSYTSEGKKKWDATRKEVIKQIQEAEKNDKKK